VSEQAVPCPAERGMSPRAGPGPARHAGRAGVIPGRRSRPLDSGRRGHPPGGLSERDSELMAYRRRLAVGRWSWRCFAYRVHGDAGRIHERGGGVLRVHRPGGLAGSPGTAGPLVGALAAYQGLLQGRPCLRSVRAGRWPGPGHGASPGGGGVRRGGCGRWAGCGRVITVPRAGMPWTSRGKVLGVAEPAPRIVGHRRRAVSGLASPAGGPP